MPKGVLDLESWYHKIFNVVLVQIKYFFHINVIVLKTSGYLYFFGYINHCLLFGMRVTDGSCDPLVVVLRLMLMMLDVPLHFPNVLLGTKFHVWVQPG